MVSNKCSDVLVIEASIDERTRLSLILKSLPQISSVVSRGSLREVEELMRSSGSLDAVFVGRSILSASGARRVVSCLENHFATKDAARIAVSSSSLSRGGMALQIAQGFDGLLLTPCSPLVLEDVILLSLKMASRNREVRFERGLEVLFQEIRSLLNDYYQKRKKGFHAGITRISLRDMSSSLHALPQEAREQFLSYAVEKFTERRIEVGNSRDSQATPGRFSEIRRSTEAA